MIIKAVYENNVLKPLGPLDPEETQDTSHEI